jgi:hypothetical protein
MACDDALFCIGDHIRPWVANWTPHRGRPGSARGTCPVREHRDKQTLSVSVKGGRIVYNCFAGCSTAEVRAGLIRADVPAECLPLSADDKLRMDLARVLEAEPRGARRDLLIGVLVFNDGVLPTGAQLVRLGKRIGLSKSAIYRDTANPDMGLGVSPNPSMGQPRHGSTRAFDASRVTALRTGVTGQAPPGVPIKLETVRPHCEGCGALIGPGKRADSRYCGNACRQRAKRQRRQGESAS